MHAMLHGRIEPMKKWQFWIGVLISAAFLWWALSKLNFGNFWLAIRTADYWWILPGVAIYFVAVWARAWRWHYLLKPIKDIKTWSMFPVTCIGYMGNNIYPARAGEVLRAVVLKRREGVPISASLATIIVEKFFDAVVMLGFVFVNLPELAKLKGSSGFLGSMTTASKNFSTMMVAQRSRDRNACPLEHHRPAALPRRAPGRYYCPCEPNTGTCSTS